MLVFRCSTFGDERSIFGSPLMSDRAHYLARTLLARLAALQLGDSEVDRGPVARERRIDTIGKVLAVELGVTDGTTLALIESAAPAVRPGTRPPDRDLTAFADFLRTRLHAQLAEA